MNINLHFASVGLLALGLGVLLGGCVTMSPSAQRLQSDPQFQKAAQDLATAYLEGQKRGDRGAAYGPGASQFYNLAEYKIIGCGHYWGRPAVYIRVKAGNKIGGNPVWANYHRGTSGNWERARCCGFFPAARRGGWPIPANGLGQPTQRRRWEKAAQPPGRTVVGASGCVARTSQIHCGICSALAPCHMPQPPLARPFRVSGGTPDPDAA